MMTKLALWRAQLSDWAWMEWFWLANARPGAFSRFELAALKTVWAKSLHHFMKWYTFGSIWTLRSYNPYAKPQGEHSVFLGSL